MKTAENVMRCPRCREIGKCLWPGYGRNWVICEHCQHRIGWEEIEIGWLLDEDESWMPVARQSAGEYN